MRRIFKAVRIGVSTAREFKAVENQLRSGLVRNHPERDSDQEFAARLDIAEDLLTALGLHEDFHWGMWAEHRRKRAAGIGLQTQSVDNTSIEKKAHEHQRKNKIISRQERY